MARLDCTLPDIVELAANGGAPDALFELGLLYASDREGTQDLVTAHKWFNLAALRGNAEARRYRQELAREMTKAQIAQAQKLARTWLSRH
jgi:TPR repeat protein